MTVSWSLAKILKIMQNPAIKPLIDFAESKGYRVSFIPKTNGDWAFGYIETGEKLILVYLREANGRFRSLPDIAFILAHECRHLEHVLQGLYPTYYNPRCRTKYIVGLSAERNCDLYAKRYVRKHFPKHDSKLMRRKYPGWRVSIHCLPESHAAYRDFLDAKMMYFRDSVAV